MNRERSILWCERHSGCRTSSHLSHLYPRLAAAHLASPTRTPGSGSAPHHRRTVAKTRGATIVASDSIMKVGVSTPILFQVIFSLGTAPE